MLKQLPNTEPFAAITAAGLSRLLEHMINGSWGILSAHKGHLSLTQDGRASNNEQMGQLKDQLRQARIGFIDLRGAWKDDQLNQFIPEDSLFLVNVTPDVVQQLAVKFEQEAYIVGLNGIYEIRKTSGGQLTPGRKIMDHLKVDPIPHDESGKLAPALPSERNFSPYSDIGGKRFSLQPSPVERVAVTLYSLNSYYYCKYNIRATVGPAGTIDEGIFAETGSGQSGRFLSIYIPLRVGV